MINYFIRPDKAIVKIDSNSGNTLVIVLINESNRKIISLSTDDSYVNRIVDASNEWTVTNETIFNQNKTEVLDYLNNQ